MCLHREFFFIIYPPPGRYVIIIIVIQYHILKLTFYNLLIWRAIIMMLNDTEPPVGNMRNAKEGTTCKHTDMTNDR